MPAMTPGMRRAHWLIREEARRLRFGVVEIRDYVVRVPGTYANEPWYAVVLDCPCGREKTLHLKAASVPDLREHLREHLVRDGLIDA